MTRMRVQACAVILPVLLLAGCSRSPEARSSRYIESGKKLMEKKDANRATLEFLNAVQAAPKNAEARYQLARAYLAGGDLRKGIVALRQTIELDPKHTAARLLLAQLETGADDAEVLKDAQRRLQGLLQETPESTDALHALALTELKLGDPEEATHHLERALMTAPTDLMVTVTLAEAKLQQQDFKAAEQVLKNACEANPKSADARVLLGRFYVARNRNADAEQEFQKALAITPDHKPALLNLATLQDQLGRKQEAEQYYKRLAGFPDKTLNPDYGIFLFQQGRIEEAIREFDRLARQDPEDRAARTRLVAAYRASNRIPEAEKVLDEALKKNSKDLDALLQRGELLIAAKKYSDAEANLNQVLHVEPNSPAVHYILSKLYQVTGRAQMQRQQLNEVLRLNPFLLPVRLEFAKILIEGKEPGAALSLLNGAPESQRDSIPVLEQRCWALLLSGGQQQAEARKEIERGLGRVRTPDLLLQDGILKTEDKRYAEARQAAHEVLAKSPDDMRALRLLVRTYAVQNQMPAAVKDVREYAAQHPKSAQVQFFLGQLLRETGDLTGARQVLSNAKALNSEAAPMDLSLAQINLLQANWTDAKQELNSILAAQGENPQARQWLGMLEVTQGNQAAAIGDFRKVVDREPENATALNNLAFLLAESGKAEEALPYAAKAVELAPNKPEFEDTLGWVMYRKGLYDNAVMHLRSAVAKSSDPRLQYHLAAAYFRTGDAARGQAALTAAERKNPNLPEAQLARQAAQEATSQKKP